jgi:hypothetical protein
MLPRALVAALPKLAHSCFRCFRRLSSQPTATAEQLSRATLEFNEELTAVFGGSSKEAEQPSLEDSYQMNRSFVAQQHEYQSECSAREPLSPPPPPPPPPPPQPAQAVVHVRQEASAAPGAPGAHLPAIHIHVPSGQGAATLHVDITIRLK